MMRMLLLVLLLLVSHAMSERDLSFGIMSSIFNIKWVAANTSDPTIRAIQLDIRNLSYALLATDTMIIRVNLNDTTDYQMIAGDSLEYNYKDGIGTECRFNAIRGLVTEGRRYIVTDTNNHCIRELSYQADEGYRASTLTGRCQRAGDAVGTFSEARFRYPYGMAMDGTSLFVTDSRNLKIKELFLDRSEVEVVHEMKEHTPYYMILGASGEFYVTVDFGVLHIEGDAEQWLVGSSTDQYTDGPFSTAKFKSPKGLAWLGYNYILIADQWAIRVRLVNLVDKTVSSICVGWGGRGGSIDECYLIRPWCFLVMDDAILLGDKSDDNINGLRLLPYTIMEGTPFTTDRYVTDEYVLLSCDAPPQIDNAYYKQQESYDEGDTVHYYCNDGYVPENTDETQLLCVPYESETHWAGKQVNCIRSTASVINIVLGVLFALAVLIITVMAIIMCKRRNQHKTDRNQTNELYTRPVRNTGSVSHTYTVPNDDIYSTPDENEGYIEPISSGLGVRK